MMLCRSIRIKPSTRAERTPELPLARELHRISRVDRTQDSGMMDDAIRSSFGRAVVNRGSEGLMEDPLGKWPFVITGPFVFGGAARTPQFRKLIKFL